jgi:integrase
MPKLTKRLVDSLAHPERGQVFLRDDELRGFALRVTAGSKSFVLEKEINGRVRRMTIGRYGALTLEQARRLAQEKIGEIAKGGDPADTRQQRMRRATFGDLEKMYLERHAVHKKSLSTDVCALNRHLSIWRNRRLSTITKTMVSALHAHLGAAGHKTGGNRVVALLRTMFNLARDWGVYDGENPASRIKFFKEVARDRFVTLDELPRLWAALRKEPNPYVRATFLVGLLTGARRSEVLTMRWADLDLRQSIWTIPDTKAGRQHVIPLAGPALNEILALPRIEGNPYVFCGRWGRSHLVNVSKPWRRIRKQAKLEDVRIHDLRRTLGSWLVAAGASLPLIGKALNHSQPSTTQIYARLQLEPVRKTLEENAEKMLAVVGEISGETEAMSV